MIIKGTSDIHRIKRLQRLMQFIFFFVKVISIISDFMTIYVYFERFSKQLDENHFTRQKNILTFSSL